MPNRLVMAASSRVNPTIPDLAAKGGVGVHPEHRGDHDDPARSPSRHGEQGGAAQVEHPVKRGVDDRVPVGVVQPGQWLVPGDPGAAHHGLHRSELLLDLTRPGGDILAVGHVERQREHPRAQLGRGLFHLDGALLVLVMAEADVPAVRGQPADRRRADAPGASADHGDTAMTLAQRFTFPHTRTTAKPPPPW
jgi:hypothetical protein